MSQKSTIKLITELGKDYDEVVKTWRDSFSLDLQAIGIQEYVDHCANYNPNDKDSSESSSEEYATDSCSSLFDTYTSSSSGNDDDDVFTVEIEVNSKEQSSDVLVSNDRMAVALVAHPPQVLEPSNLIRTQPGIPVQLKRKGYRLCGDNIDKNIHNRHLRSDRRNQSVYFFHVYAVENRIEVSHLSDMSMPRPISDLDRISYEVLPKTSDDLAMRNTISILISRVLCKYLDFLNISI